MNEMVEKVVEQLNSKKFNACFCGSREELLSEIAEIIGEAAKIARGASVTLDQIGFNDFIEKKLGKTLYDGWRNKGHDMTRREEFRASLCSDVYVSGTNAITEKGELVFVDGTGNRVAALSYGPEKVIIVSSTSKIVKNYSAALTRVKQIAAPKNAVRLNFTENPCMQTGKCMNCQVPTRMCNLHLHMQYPPKGTEYHVLLVEEQLGF